MNWHNISEYFPYLFFINRQFMPVFLLCFCLLRLTFRVSAASASRHASSL